jgi:Major capsid protein Gp23
MMDFEMRALQPSMQEDAGRRARWAYLTEGLADYKRRVTEVLLDNQQNDLLSRTQRKGLFEDVVTTANYPAFTTFSFPLIRRVFPRLITNELVSVQPMSQPTGKVFYFDIEYSATGSPLVNARVDLLANFSQGYGANIAENATVPELDLRISSADVSAESRKLKAKWSLESEQDLFAYFGLNAENELMTAVSDEIAREIDLEILQDLFNFAGAGNTNWSKSGGSASPYSSLDPKVYQRTLFDSIVDANNNIFKKRYRNANWLVVSADVATRLEKLDEFRLFPSADPVGTIVQGPNLFGTLAGRFTVYKNPWATGTVVPTGALQNDTMLLGFKGTTPLDTGYIWAPYIPLLTTPPFTDPNTMNTVRGMMTRFAKKGVIPECYATVTLTT